MTVSSLYIDPDRDCTGLLLVDVEPSGPKHAELRLFCATAGPQKVRWVGATTR